MRLLLASILIIGAPFAHAYKFDLNKIDELQSAIAQREDPLKEILLNYLKDADRAEAIDYIESGRWFNEEFGHLQNIGIPDDKLSKLRQLIEKTGGYNTDLLMPQYEQLGRWNEAYFKAFVDEIRGLGEIYIPYFDDQPDDIALKRANIPEDLKNEYLDLLINIGFLLTPSSELQEPYNVSEAVEEFLKNNPSVEELVLASSHTRKFGDDNFGKLVVNLSPQSGADVIANVHDPELWQQMPDDQFIKVEDDSNITEMLAYDEETIAQIFRVLKPGGVVETPAISKYSARNRFLNAGFEIDYGDFISKEEALERLQMIIKGKAWGKYYKQHGDEASYEDFSKQYLAPSEEEFLLYAEDHLHWKAIEDDGYLLPKNFRKPLDK